MLRTHAILCPAGVEHSVVACELVVTSKRLTSHGWSFSEKPKSMFSQKHFELDTASRHTCSRPKRRARDCAPRLAPRMKLQRRARDCAPRLAPCMKLQRFKQLSVQMHAAQAVTGYGRNTSRAPRRQCFGALRLVTDSAHLKQSAETMLRHHPLPWGELLLSVCDWDFFSESAFGQLGF